MGRTVETDRGRASVLAGEGAGLGEGVSTKTEGRGVGAVPPVVPEVLRAPQEGEKDSFDSVSLFSDNG